MDTRPVHWPSPAPYKKGLTACGAQIQPHVKTSRTPHFLTCQRCRYLYAIENQPDEVTMTPSDQVHPAPMEFTAEEIAQDHILQFFHYAHLPPALQTRSIPFCALARQLLDITPRNPERTVALRKLLEAKDAAVRAFVAGEGRS